MGISIINNTTSLIAQNNIQKASTDAERAVTRLSSGKVNAYPGDHVSEVAIATTLSTNVSLQKVALDTSLQASQLIDEVYSAMGDQMMILERQAAIAAQASSDTVSDVERKSMQREFGTLVQQFDLAAEQASYNGVSLLTGGFTGASYINTRQTVSQMMYNVTRADQYVSHGVVGDNPIIAANSSATVVDKIGKGRAQGIVSFSSNLQVNDKIVLNGRQFTAIDAKTVNSTVMNDQFKLGNYIDETLQNLVKVLNTSAFSEVNPASYRVTKLENGDFALAISYNVSGSVGNNFTIEAELAPPVDLGFSSAKGGLAFDANLLVNDEVHINGVVFVATDNAELAKENDKNFLIGPDITSTVTNIVDKLNSSTLAEVSLATYAQDKDSSGALQSKFSITYQDKGFEGNDFTIGANINTSKNSGAVTSDEGTTDWGGKAATSGELTLAAVFVEGDTITIGNEVFTAASTADAASKKFTAGDINANIDAVQKAIDASSLKGKITVASSAANKLTISAATDGVAGNMAYDINIAGQSEVKGNLAGGVDDTKFLVSRVKINDTYFQTSNGVAVVKDLIGGESKSVGKKATIVVEYDSTTNYAATEKVTFGGIDYTFAADNSSPPTKDAPTVANPNTVQVGKNLAETMANLIEAVSENSASSGFALEFNSTTSQLIMRVDSLPVNSDDSNKQDVAPSKDSFNLDGTATLKLTSSDSAFAKFSDALTSLGATAGAVTVADIISAADAKSEIPFQGTQNAKEREILMITNRVNINNTGERAPSNGIISGTLLGGTDQTTGSFATAIIDFSSNAANLSFVDGDRVTLNDEIFTFRDNKITNGQGDSAIMPLTQNAVDIGDSLDEALNNLAQVVNATMNDASKALLQYDKENHKLTITAKSSGVAGNDYGFDFGGSEKLIKYNVGDGPTSEKVKYTISDIAKNGAAFATLGTEDKAVLFPQNMKGEFSELKAVFNAGSNGADNEFTANSVKFMIRLNGETYETGDIELSGGNKTKNVLDGLGYKSLGNSIAGNTDLVFQRIGGDPTEAGFTFRVRAEGLTIQADSSVEDIQNELNSIISASNYAIIAGQLQIGLSAEGKEITSCGLNSIDQFIGSGSALAGSHLSGNVQVLGSTGLTKSQGVIEFKNNNFQNGDFLMINGSKVIANQDFTVGDTLTDSMLNIVAYLNQSADSNIAQASYSMSADNRVVITYKQAGTMGNDFKIGAEFFQRPGSLATDLNGAKINGNAEFASITSEVALGQKDLTTSDSEVILGADNKNVNNIMPAYLVGKIENLTASFIDGYHSTTNPNSFTSNALLFSATVNGNVYTGQISLSGGNYREGVIDGSGYNGLGSFIAGGSKLVLNSGDGTHAIVLTVDRDGIVLPGKPDGKTSKNDVLKELSKVVSGMNTGLNNIVLNQKRQISSFDVSKTFATVLRGIKAENIYYQGPDFDSEGKAGLITEFNVDNVKSVISVKIGDFVYSQSLGDNSEQGGLGDSYDSIAKIIKGGVDTTLTLATADPNDGRALMINLQGVADIDLSTEMGAKALSDALNLAFGASGGSGLRYQIGVKPTDLITLTFPDVTSKSIYLDEQNQYTEIDVLTREDAILAAGVIYNAIDKLRQERATIGATQGQFEVVANNLRNSMRASKSSISVLVDADIPEVSADYALSALRVNAASSAFVHSLSSLKEMLGRILQM